MFSGQNRRVEIPIALTIAGSDSSAGAGIQADLKTFSALGVYGVSAVTCVVAEMPGRVVRLEPVNVDLVRAQIETLGAGFPIAAIKTGLLSTAEIVSAVARTIVDLARKIDIKVPLVIDPVMQATSGDALLRGDAVQTYENELFPLAALITPNLDEAAKLIGAPIRDLDEMRAAGRKLVEKFGVPFLIKGGHLSGDAAIDLLFSVDGEIAEFSAPFSRGIATHGTGCTYSAAITAGLARGLALGDSVQKAKEFVSAAITQHFTWDTARVSVHALNHSPKL
ncbi:MAG: hydroxymethylpyrimidine/phosphomethylpyrimidine kinase [Verrucomicrobiota bacterium]|jgi:hydroxymethylpyrimidine/phosphomethylpyrimidine kinase